MTDNNGSERGVRFIYHSKTQEKPLSLKSIQEAMATVAVSGYPVELTRTDGTRISGTLSEGIVEDSLLGQSIVLADNHGATKISIDTISRFVAFEN